MHALRLFLLYKQFFLPFAREIWITGSLFLFSVSGMHDLAGVSFLVAYLLSLKYAAFTILVTPFFCLAIFAISINARSIK